MIRSASTLIGLGLVAGALGGLLGIGGGTLIVPGLVFLRGFSQHRAHGTSLVSALAISIAGLVRYSLDGNVDCGLAVGIAAGGVIGAVFGARAAGAIKGLALRRIFSLFLVVVAVRMIVHALQTNGAAAGAHAMFGDTGTAYWLVILATGLVTGFMSGLLGIGGGLVMIPAMVILLAVPQKMAQGVSLAAIIPTALSGIITHRRLGNVDFGVGKWIGLGAALGAYVGAMAASGLDNNTLMLSFAVFILFVATVMALRKNAN